jgi:hypothetical protein
MHHKYEYRVEFRQKLLQQLTDNWNKTSSTYRSFLKKKKREREKERKSPMLENSTYELNGKE